MQRLVQNDEVKRTGPYMSAAERFRCSASTSITASTVFRRIRDSCKFRRLERAQADTSSSARTSCVRPPRALPHLSEPGAWTAEVLPSCRNIFRFYRFIGALLPVAPGPLLAWVIDLRRYGLRNP